jgi:hypothetical protein
LPKLSKLGQSAPTKKCHHATKNKSALPKLFYFALYGRLQLISAHIRQQEPRGSLVEFHICWPFVKSRLVLFFSSSTM